MATTPIDTIGEPRTARWLFASPGSSWIWLIVRVWLGYEWLHAGLSKIFGPEGGGFWRGGLAVKGFAAGAIAESHGPNAQVTYGWWVAFLRDFVIPNHAWIAKLVAISEIAVGLALILGLFTGIAALGGLVLNFTYVFSGAVSTNPVFIILGVLLVLAWRNAGFLGLDGYLLPRIGTPWQAGSPLARLAHLSRRPGRTERDMTAA
jgi:thiosulfate dehydrogenase [quinone] large subunit